MPRRQSQSPFRQRPLEGATPPARPYLPTSRLAASARKLAICLSPLRPWIAGLSSSLLPRLGGLWRQDGSPGHRARGLAAGVFTGCLPFFGLQIVLGVALAAAIRGNRILAAAGTWISNPLTTLPMCWLNYQLGAWLIGPGPAWPGRHNLDPERLGELGWAFTSRLMVGSLLLGAVASVVVGAACWRWLHHRDKRKAIR